MICRGWRVASSFHRSATLHFKAKTRRARTERFIQPWLVECPNLTASHRWYCSLLSRTDTHSIERRWLNSLCSFIKEKFLFYECDISKMQCIEFPLTRWCNLLCRYRCRIRNYFAFLLECALDFWDRFYKSKECRVGNVHDINYWKKFNHTNNRHLFFSSHIERFIESIGVHHSLLMKMENLWASVIFNPVERRVHIPLRLSVLSVRVSRWTMPQRRCVVSLEMRKKFPPLLIRFILYNGGIFLCTSVVISVPREE